MILFGKEVSSMNQVKDYMLTDVIYVQKNDTLRHLLNVFIENEIASVPVVDEEMRLQGMISDGDVFQTLTPMDREIGMIYSFAYRSEERRVGQEYRYR